MKTQRAVSAALFVLLVGPAGARAEGDPPLPKLPADFGESLDRLRASFASGPFPGAHCMRTQVERNRSEIEAILSYANDTPAHSRAVAAHLLSSLVSYAGRFQPGKAIDEDILNTNAYEVGTEPGHGLNVEAYLLLGVAEQRGSAGLIRTALAAAYDVVQAHSYLAEQRTLRRTPGLDDEIARGKREGGGFMTGVGAEVAWSCEQSIVKLHGCHRPYLPHAALLLVQDYWEWRRDRMRETGAVRSLDLSDQHRTMQWVKRLIDALPAAPED